MRLTATSLTFAEIADRWGRENTAHPERLGCEEIRLELYRSFWRGEFEDDSGENSRLWIGRERPGDNTRVGDGRFVDHEGHPTAEHLRVSFGTQDALEAQKLFDGPNTRLVKPDALELDDLHPLFRSGYLNRLEIDRDDFANWCDEHGHEPPSFWLGAMQAPRQPRRRKSDPVADADYKNRIEAVLAAGRRRWRASPDLLRTQIARLLTEKGESKDFGFETVKKILSGKYDPMKRLKIAGLSKPKRQ